MAANQGICDSCDSPSEDLKQIRRGGRFTLCGCCTGWVRVSLRRTRRVPAWIRPDSRISVEDRNEMRERFLQMRDSQGGGRWAERRMIFELGFPYLGPLNDRAWGFALTAMQLQEFPSNGSVPFLPDEVINEELAKLEEVGVMHLPSNPMMRKQIAHLLRGDFGLANKRRFITGLFLWLVGEDEFLARDPAAWARSFRFLQEVGNDLGDRAAFVDEYIRVTGSSGNVYRIRPRPHPPYYIVSREVGDQHPPICIDPVSAHTVVFGDILAGLVLALYDDQMSARHIDTLARHVFGPRTVRHANPGVRNVNIENLWRRALGNMPGEAGDPRRLYRRWRRARGEVPDEPVDHRALFEQWRRVIDRFQTNLEDWSIEEEEEE
ncbi:MAG: hypothetical protein MKZ56_04420 [Candidatus Thalassarchaeum sp.]|nr:hypothetical protein [Candidatus Thalassarchaeum sp.]